MRRYCHSNLCKEVKGIIKLIHVQWKDEKVEASHHKYPSLVSIITSLLVVVLTNNTDLLRTGRKMNLGMLNPISYNTRVYGLVWN